MKFLYLMRASLLLFLLLFITLLFGCRGGLGKPENPLQKAMASKITNENLFVAEDYDKRQPLSVAILPFDNQTKESEAALLLRRLFYNNFSSLAYQDIELSKVDAGLTHFDPASTFESSDIAKIGQNLKADAVIIGRVTKFKTLYAGLYSSFSVAFEMKMIATKDNLLLWSVKHTETRRSGNVPFSPIGAIISAAQRAIDLSRYNMINTSNKLCRVSIESIPPSVNLKGQSYPRIYTLVHDGPNRILKKGDQLNVGVESSPGLKANFVITPRNTPIAMQEKENGSYVGTYIVRDGDEIDDGQIVVTLKDQWDNVCRWEDTLGLVSIDGTPPQPPTGIKTSASNGQVTIHWNESDTKDIAGYQVLRSKTPLSGYSKVTSTEFTRFKDQNLENGTTYFYRILAKDSAGNLSPKTAGIPATPVPPGPTLVSGKLGPDTVWHPGGNPYFFDGDVILPAGSRMRIEPGVVIKAADTTRFLVQGQLKVKGQANAPVLFTSDHENGTWEGITFDHLEGESSLSHFEITQAINGIHIIDSSPNISNGIIKECNNGLIISGEKAAPKIKQITVYQNKKSGIISNDLAHPYITTSKIVYNGSAGLFLSRCNGKILGNEISYNHLGVLVKQASVVLAGNRIQYNTSLDLKSEETAISTLKIDLNYFGAPKDITIFSSQADQDREGLLVLASSNLRGPRKKVSFKSFPASKKPNLNHVLWIKGQGGIELDSKPLKKKNSTVSSDSDGKTSKSTSSQGKSSPTSQKEIPPPSDKITLDAFIEGITMARKEAYPEAIASFKKALKDTTREAEVRFWLGFCHLQNGQLKKALFNYNKAVKLDPENIEYLLHLGSALHLIDNRDKAKIVYQEIIRRDPDNHDARTFLKLLEENKK
jgi:TolA-binding protein